MGLSTGEQDIYSPGGMGGFGGFGGGGIGGLGLIGLIGINSFLGRDGLGTGVAGAAALGAGTTVLEQNVSNIREEIGTLGNEIQVAFSASNINNANNFRALDNQICGVNQNLANLNFAQTIQNMNNTQAIQNQATANQIIAAENACAIKGLIQAESDATRSLVHAETDRIVALMNSNLIDDLRNELLQERRSRDNREIEINVTQTNQQTQQVLQNQMQQQGIIFANALNALGDQVNRAANSVVNVGSGTVAGGQTNSQANTKVNS